MPCNTGRLACGAESQKVMLTRPEWFARVLRLHEGRLAAPAGEPSPMAALAAVPLSVVTKSAAAVSRERRRVRMAPFLASGHHAAVSPQCPSRPRYLPAPAVRLRTSC